MSVVLLTFDPPVVPGPLLAEMAESRLLTEVIKPMVLAHRHLPPSFLVFLSYDPLHPEAADLRCLMVDREELLRKAAAALVVATAANPEAAKWHEVFVRLAATPTPPGHRLCVIMLRSGDVAATAEIFDGVQPVERERARA